MDTVTSARRTLDLTMSEAQWQPVVVGIDPGGAATGIIIRHKDCLLWADTIRRTADEQVSHYILRVLQSLDAAIAEAAMEDNGRGLIAVEDVTDPNPHVRITNPRGIIDTAIVVGAIIGHHPAILVPPGGHGSGPFGAYPATLRPTWGKGKGKDGLRHARSAWDIAGGALIQHRYNTAAAKGAP